MRRLFALSLLLTTLSAVTVAQTLRVNVGQVTYAHRAAAVGNMTFANGSTLTVQGMTYNVANVSDITIDANEVADNTVSVNYLGSTANIVVAGNIAPYLTISAQGAKVSIVQSADLQQEVSYTLSGSSTNGSFVMDGEYKANFTLNNLSLTSASGPAIDIEDGKAIGITLTGTNTVSDAANGSHNAALYVEGHATIGGTGTLNVSGLTKHAIATDEYIVISSGTINVQKAQSDGLHINERFQMDGGNISIAAAGDGIDIGFRGANKGTKDQYEHNGFAEINGGTLTITTTGDATKGLKADSTVIVTAGTINITTTGAAYYDTAEADITSSSALKTGGSYQQTGGNVTLLSTGSGGKGLNATGAVNVSGGTLQAVTTGARYKYSSSLDTKPQALKSDGNIMFTGGTIRAAVVDTKATTIKTDFTFSLTGATVMAIGGKAAAPNSGTQAYKTYTASVTAGQTVTYDGVSFTVPSAYSVSSATILVSKP